MAKNLPANEGYMRHRFDPWVGKDALKEGIAIYSSILAWKIPWMEEPSGIHSIDLQRVRHG